MVSLSALNVDQPASLLQPGLAAGTSLHLDLAGISEHVDSRVASIKTCTSARHELIALKIVFAPDVQPPHDLRKEIRLLAQLDHPGICPLYNAYLIDSHYVLALPYYPLSLRELLDNPAFTPSAFPAFEMVTKSLIRQMCESIAYLHEKKIAHRDLAPANWMISRDGRVALIDFGVAWSEQDPGSEGRDRLHFELGTGPYRAPELLFGSKAYNSFALDRWALGAVLAEFFTAVEVPQAASPLSDVSYSYAPPPSREIGRKSLFEGGLSDFTLIGSIFKTLGTPTAETWPEASSLPDFGKFGFKQFPPRDLAELLPKLPQGEAKEAVDFVDSFLKYPFGERMRAQDALLHPFLGGVETPLLYQGKGIHEWIASFLP